MGRNLNSNAANLVHVNVSSGTRKVDSEIISESSILVSAEDFIGGSELRIL